VIYIFHNILFKQQINYDFARLANDETTTFFFNKIFFALAILIGLTACSPPFDWRIFHSKDAPFQVLFPAKASQFTRKFTLAGKPLEMHMSGAETRNISFAVGAAKLLDKDKIPTTLTEVQSGIIKNFQSFIQDKNASTQLKMVDWK